MIGVRDRLVSLGREALEKKKEAVEGFQPGLMSEASRYFILSQTDSLWKEHLQAMKFVQTAVGLRGYAQKDPLTEYKLEGFALFKDMQARIRRNVIYSIYQFQTTRLNKVDSDDKNKDSSGSGGDTSQDAAESESTVSVSS